MEENKIPTAAEFMAKKYEELGQSINHESHMIEFAKMHVKKALDAAKKVNPQCMWSDEEDCYIAVQNEYGIEKCYPLENIK